MKQLITILFLLNIALANSQTFDEILIKKYSWEAGKYGLDLQRYLKFSKLYSESISLASVKYSIPTELIEAVITVESNWNSDAKGMDNCNGLMQVQGGTFNSQINILNGTGILKYYLTKCKNDTAKSLTAYNRGYSGMVKYYKKFNRTSNYAKRVLELFHFFKNMERWSMKRLYILVLFLAVVSYTESFSIGKYLIHCNSKLLSASHDSLLAQVGVKESTGRNDGFKVEQYLKSVGLTKGNPYCAAGQYWCFKSACNDFNMPYSEILIYKTGSTVRMYNEGMKKGIKQTPKPKLNDLIFWRKPNTWSGHVERIIEVLKAGWIRTVAFNTSSGVSGSQNDGQGVFIRKRNVNHFLGRMVLRGYLGFLPIEN